MKGFEDFDNSEKTEPVLIVLDEKALEEEKGKFTYDKETENLLREKKNMLNKELDEIKETLNTIDNIYEIEYLNQEKISQITKKTFSEKKKVCFYFDSSPCCLSMNFNLLGPIFCIFNLIGIFQLIIILKTTQKELIFGIKSFLFEKNRTDVEAFVNYYESVTYKQIPDFDIIFISSIVGNFFLKCIGFKFSSFIFMLINLGLLVLFRGYNFPERYNFLKFLLLLLYFVLFYISFGGIALFSHQMFFEYLIIYKNKSYDLNDFYVEDADHNMNKIKTNDKKDINIEINEIIKENENIETENNILIDNNTGINDSQSLEDNKLIDNSNEERDSEQKEDNKLNENVDDIKNDGEKSSEKLNMGGNNNKQNKIKTKYSIYIYFTLIVSYFICIGLNYNFVNTYILDSNNATNITNNTNTTNSTINMDNKLLMFWPYISEYVDPEKNTDFEIFIFFSIVLYCGFTLGSISLYHYYTSVFEKDETNQKDKNKNNYEVKVFRIFGYLIFKKSQKAKKVWCSCFRLFCRKFYYIFCGAEGCECLKCTKCCEDCEKCQCCHCCKEEMTESNQVNNSFCYCFKVQNSISWICDLLSRKKLTLLITSIITLEMSIIGFEYKLKRNINENYKYWLVYLISYFFMAMRNELGTPKGFNSTYTTVVLFSLLFSGISYFGKGKLKNFTTQYLEPGVVAMVKFYYFYIMKSLIISYDNNNPDLISNSMVVSIFLTIYKLISYLFSDVFFPDKKYEKNFILFQFIFGIINVATNRMISEE